MKTKLDYLYEKLFVLETIRDKKAIKELKKEIHKLENG
jgi:hypothetical protein